MLIQVLVLFFFEVFFVMNYIEYICPVVCFVFCLIHGILNSIISSKQNKKIDKICDRCLQPVEKDVEHVCDPELVALLESQKLLLDDYIKRYSNGD